MKMVSKDEFFKSIQTKNVHPQIQGSYPYKSLWKGISYQDSGTVYGITVMSYIMGNSGLTKTEYYLP